MSRKSVPFPPSGPGRAETPSGRGRSTAVIDARTDEWVSDRNAGGAAARNGADARFMLDLAAERGLAEIVAISFMTPIALGGFWFLRAMAGRARF